MNRNFLFIYFILPIVYRPLMFEAHMILKQDEVPQLTLVLMNSRVIVLPEWLNDAKDFLNLSTSFTPKC